MYMSVLNKFKYKQCLCILTLLKCNANLWTRFVEFTDKKKKKMKKS